MRELLFTNCGLTSVSNVAVSNRKCESPSLQTPVIENEDEHQNFAEKIKRISGQRRPSYSFEISPSRSEKDFEHLVKSAADAVSGGLAAFASVTWHLAPPAADRPPSHWCSVPAVRTALGLSELVGRGGVLLHLAAAGLRRRDVAHALAAAGPSALFLVRGDGETSGGDFAHAVDLVRFVRSLPEGERLTVGVAGYPLGHPESRSRQEDLLHLREKVARVDAALEKSGSQSAALSATVTCGVPGILVHILSSNTVNFLETEKLLSMHQYGFRKHRSRETQLALFSHDILRAMDERLQADCVFLDFRKAFDMVPHCRLLTKVKAGADFIISQVVFDAATFLQFVEDCRHVGITVPILAGVPIVTDSGTLGRLCKLCRVPVPEAGLRELARGAGAGLRWCARTCRQLLAAGADGIHFFTLNSIDNLKEVVRQLAAEGTSAETGASGRDQLPQPVYEARELPKTEPHSD